MCQGRLGGGSVCTPANIHRDNLGVTHFQSWAQAESWQRKGAWKLPGPPWGRVVPVCAGCWTRQRPEPVDSAEGFLKPEGGRAEAEVKEQKQVEWRDGGAGVG